MKKILIIEDDKLIINPLAEKLTANNISVVKSLSGEDGLKIANTEIFDCIVVDINLPNINGMQVIEKIRQGVVNKDTLIIIFSNSDYMEYIEKAVKNDVTVYFTKSDKNLEDVYRIIKEKLKI